MLRQTVRRTSA